MKIPLEKARICLECDTIHDLAACPQCGCSTYYYLANWIKPQPLRAPAPAPAETPVEPSPAAKPKKKSRHLLRKTLMAGAGLVAAYTLLFKPSRKRPPPGDE